MFDNDFKAGKLKCHTYSYFYILFYILLFLLQVDIDEQDSWDLPKLSETWLSSYKPCNMVIFLNKIHESFLKLSETWLSRKNV